MTKILSDTTGRVIKFTAAAIKSALLGFTAEWGGAHVSCHDQLVTLWKDRRIKRDPFSFAVVESTFGDRKTPNYTPVIEILARDFGLDEVEKAVMFFMWLCKHPTKQAYNKVRRAFSPFVQLEIEYQELNSFAVVKVIQ